MRSIGLARCFIVKYADEINEKEKGTPSKEEKPPVPVGATDTSLGAPIPADKAQRWKDSLILVYDRIKEGITRLPFFQQMYADMKEEPILNAFNNIIDSYVVYIANSSLKDAFLFAVKYIEALNGLRDKLPTLVKDRNRMLRLDEAIYSTQNYIWFEAKDILNIHDIGSGAIPLSPEDREEMKKIFNRAVGGTWRYGPLRNPTKPPFLKGKKKSLLKRLEEEMELEKGAK